MHFWQPLTFTETEQLVQAARIAEELGFTGITLPDHLFFTSDHGSPYPASDDGTVPENYGGDFPDLWTTIATLAAKTTTLKFMSAVCILPLHNPIEVAKAAGTIAYFNDERILLGAGVGWKRDEFDTVGVDFHTRGKRTNEWVEVLRHVWSGKPFQHHGQFLRLDADAILPAPPTPPPVIMCGSAPAVLKRAATIGDGWANEVNTISELAVITADLHQMRAEAGRGHLPFKIMVTLGAEANRFAPVEPTLDDLHKLEEMGVTAIVCHPFPSMIGRPTTLDQKKREMERFAGTFIKNTG